MLGVLQVSPQANACAASTHGPREECFMPALPYVTSVSQSNHSTTGGTCPPKRELGFQIKNRLCSRVGAVFSHE